MLCVVARAGWNLAGVSVRNGGGERGSGVFSSCLASSCLGSHTLAVTLRSLPSETHSRNSEKNAQEYTGLRHDLGGAEPKVTVRREVLKLHSPWRDPSPNDIAHTYVLHCSTKESPGPMVYTTGPM